MKFAVFAAFSLFASLVSAFHVVSPYGITSCAPLTVQYDTTTGTPPFSLSFHTDSAGGPVAAAFIGVSGTEFTWSAVTIRAGVNIVIVLSDSSGLGSATPPITVSTGSSDVCLNNPTSIPSLPPVTSTNPPTASFPGESSRPYSLSTTTTSSSVPLSSVSSSSVSSLSRASSLSSQASSLSSQASSLSSRASSASNVASSISSVLSSIQSSPRPTATGGLGTSGGVINSANLFGLGVITIVGGAFLI